MTSFERCLYDLIPKSLYKYLKDHKLPSLYHCSGRNKLFGDYYGRAISEEIKIYDKQIIYNLSLLSILLRSYIVIDDFLKDNTFCINFETELNLWLRNIECCILNQLVLLEEESDQLWVKYLSIYENAYNNFNTKKLYNSVLEKCSFIYLPLELNIIKEFHKNTAIKKIMGYYLFSLQLVDDFHDMEEDLSSPKNHNLFLSNISNKNHSLLINKKYTIILALIQYIEENLSEIKNLINSEIILHFFNNSLDWLKRKMIIFSNLNTLNVFSNSYENFYFDDQCALNILSNFENNSSINFSDFKAENMHTIPKPI